MLILSDAELSPLMMSSESSVVPCHPQGSERDLVMSGAYQEFPESPQRSHHAQRHRGHLHQWDINDNVLPTPDTHDPFELWPTGHSRRVYQADSDDARRHVSGWAMRNTNNHNALILKKSCLGVLVCSMDCMLESGRKVHLRPAICDKARRKQMGKPCPNPGCPGKLDLLSCRGHCGYPVTHFWRHVNRYVYFQAKGFHDHPRPEVKSLSEKGRHAFTKQLKQEGDRVNPMTLKRRFPILTNEEIPDKKMFISAQDEVMCSCPPFECVCPKSHSHMVNTSMGYFKDTHAGHYLPHRSHHGVGAGLEQLAAAPFTQINITNTCLPPSTVDVTIPGYDLYASCPRFGFHPHLLDSEVRMFSNCNTKEDPSSSQSRIHGGDYRQHDLSSCASVPSGHTTSTPQRTMASFNAVDDRDEFSRFRLSTGQSFSSPSPVNDTRGQVVKTEPGTAFFCSRSPSSPSSRAYTSDMYRDLSPEYQSPPPSPRLEDYQNKFNSAHEEFSKEQQDQEPTYITLTSPQRDAKSISDTRDFNACRLSYTNTPPNTTCSALDNILYPPQPTQVTRVDSVPSGLVSHRPPAQRESFITAQMSHSRRSSTSLLHRSPMGNAEALNPTGTSQRGNSFPTSYSSTPLHIDPSTTPITMNNDPCLPTYPSTGSNYTSLGAPYGYFCNEMLQTPAQQAYRNRSINITLTYN
ncbi:hypothetical protein BgiMline_012714 [Biomphalaria glabrata]|uniref:Uncharacterized protein LOC106064650 n=2 Tax=Biomphalaria TaxID=6525 RepID=A0A9U8E980_BIOGL|nr:uncharacterized protein LOC106064650 [Biomphalaria glabrata]KAI8749621.1 hypothetical protein BgiMline_016571 [Biomphalaria glabrata]